MLRSAASWPLDWLRKPSSTSDVSAAGIQGAMGRPLCVVAFTGSWHSLPRTWKAELWNLQSPERWIEMCRLKQPESRSEVCGCWGVVANGIRLVSSVCSLMKPYSLEHSHSAFLSVVYLVTHASHTIHGNLCWDNSPQFLNLCRPSEVRIFNTIYSFEVHCTLLWQLCCENMQNVLKVGSSGFKCSTAVFVFCDKGLLYSVVILETSI